MNTTKPATKTTKPAAKIANQFAWHRNPNPGAAAGPCEVCGCAGKVRAYHRALRADELTRAGARAAYTKLVSKFFGNDHDSQDLDWNGNPVK